VSAAATEADRKRRAELQALTSLAGIALHRQAEPERLLCPGNDKARVTSAGQVGDHQNEHADSANNRAGCVATADPLKAWKTAQAEAILAGFTASLIDGDDGAPLLLVSRWALTKGFTSLADFRAWLQPVTGRANVHQGG
jgi:hypothetical protein